MDTVSAVLKFTNDVLVSWPAIREGFSGIVDVSQALQNMLDLVPRDLVNVVRARHDGPTGGGVLPGGSVG